MARLLIVSRSMALAMRLADQHEVIEHSANDLDNLIPYLDVDVLVLDLGNFPIVNYIIIRSYKILCLETPVIKSFFQPVDSQLNCFCAVINCPVVLSVFSKRNDHNSHLYCINLAVIIYLGRLGSQLVA